MSNSSIWPIHRTLSGATTPSQRGTPHSSNLQYYWSLTIILLNVISRTLIGEVVLPLYRDPSSVFYSPSQPGWKDFVLLAHLDNDNTLPLTSHLNLQYDGKFFTWHKTKYNMNLWRIYLTSHQIKFEKRSFYERWTHKSRLMSGCIKMIDPFGTPLLEHLLSSYCLQMEGKPSGTR